MGTVGVDEAAAAGAITTGAGGRGRGVRGGALARWANGLGAPPGQKPYSTAGGAVPAAAAVRRRVRVKMRPEGGKIFRAIGLPGGEGADAAGSVSTTESSPCKVLVGRGARWETLVAAAGASAESWSPRTTKTEAKAGLAVNKKNSGEDDNRRWRRKQIHQRRISPKEQRGRQSSYVVRVRENRENPKR